MATPTPRWRFSLRSALVALLVIGVLLGWRASLLRERRHSETLQRKIAHLEGELRYDLDRLLEALRASRDQNDRGQSLVIGSGMLRGMQIRSDEALFHRSLLIRLDLTDATLIGGGGSFKSAVFAYSTLTGATLTGGDSSFQESSFKRADLSGAVFTGGGASFQGSSFSGARMVDAVVNVTSPTAFQAVNLNGAHCQGADLASIDTNALASCYFDEPPRYDSETRFPSGFDPSDQGWEFAE